MDHLTFLLALGVITDSPIFYPFHQIVRYIYARPVCYVLQFFLQQKLSKKLRVFARRSSHESSSSQHFNCFFSDLDIGFCIEDELNLTKARSLYYHTKALLFFLGELEIFTASELEELNRKPPLTKEIYEELRDLRKVNWIKNQLKAKDRHRYHRYKDHRALRILKSKNGWSSIRAAMASMSNELSKKMAIPFPSQLKDFRSSNSFYCPYLSMVVKLQNSDTRTSQLLLLLSCTPPRIRDIEEVDNFLAKIRSQAPEINSLFNELRRYEFIVASAFIRGASKTESWHDGWIRKLAE